MIDFHTQFVEALESVLPTYYEMTLTSGIGTPCISYMETNNYSSSSGDTIGYSFVTYQVKIWSNDLEEIQRYALQVDEVLRTIGFRRVSSGELYDRESTMIQKIMSYEGLALENY